MGDVRIEATVHAVVSENESGVRAERLPFSMYATPMVCINQRRAKARAARETRTLELAEKLVWVSRRRAVLKRPIMRRLRTFW
jgi:hypothetical protein